MGEKRITVSGLRRLLDKYDQESEICFVPEGMQQGVSLNFLEITERPISLSENKICGHDTLIIIGLSQIL